jgi:phosphotransferase system HPr-like phosphotransfer protein
MRADARAGFGSNLTLNYANAATFANGIQALQATGFQVGTNCQVNTNGSTYFFVALNDY